MQSLALITGLGTLFGLWFAGRSFLRIHNQPPSETDTQLKKESLALQETKEMYTHLMDAIDSLTNKATALLENSGLILTMFGVLQIALLQAGQSDWYKIGLGLVVLFYLITIALLLWVLHPKGYRMVFVADWEGIDNAIRNHTLEGATTQLLSNYLARIQHNDVVHHSNVVRYQWATRTFAVTIILLVALSLFAQR